MVKFNSIGQIEHAYAFEDAVVNSEVLNGAFGVVTNGVFAAAVGAKKAIMQIETGDNVGMDKYPIPTKSRVRVINLEKFNGQTVEIYGAQLPATYTTGDNLVSKADGTLEVKASATAPYYKITKIIGNKLGVEATIVAQ